MESDVRSPVGSHSITTLDQSFLRKRAEQVCEEGLDLHLEGQTAKAIPVYARSLRICPTAEAHCYLGWAYSSHGRYDLAVRECLKSIAIDPDYGNPYNDIGSYLVSQGKSDEAVGWFEKAKRARNCDAKHFPYMNLGRVFAARGWTLRAIREFEKALTLKPGEKSCVEALRKLKRHLA